MAQLYRERYPQTHCSALLHSFNEDIPEAVPPPPPMHPVRCVLAGNINHSCSDAATRLAAAVDAAGGSLTIFSGTQKAYLDELGVIHDGVTYETVSRDLILSRLREADILLLAHGFKGQLSAEEYRTIFPTKTIEYLISGRPILAHTPSDCYLTSFLREHECALVVDQPDQDALVAALQRLREDGTLRAQLVRNALRTAEIFRASIVAASLRGVLDIRAGEGVRPTSGLSWS
jgi:glycosyltransferase involved in cell wall biosynthesis